MELSEALKANASVLEELIGINDTWLRFRDVRSIESQDKLDSMQYSGIYLLTQPSELVFTTDYYSIFYR